MLFCVYCSKHINVYLDRMLVFKYSGYLISLRSQSGYFLSPWLHLSGCIGCLMLLCTAPFII